MVRVSFNQRRLANLRAGCSLSCSTRIRTCLNCSSRVYRQLYVTQGDTHAPETGSGYLPGMSGSSQSNSKRIDPVEHHVVVLPLRVNSRRVVVFTIALALVGILLLDINLRTGVAIGFLYVPVIFLSLLVWDTKATAIAALVATGLT